jgi:hypothetical protein
LGKGKDQELAVTHSDFFDDQSNLPLDLDVGDAALKAAKGRRVRTSSEVQSMLPVPIQVRNESGTILYNQWLICS